MFNLLPKQRCNSITGKLPSAEPFPSPTVQLACDRFERKVTRLTVYTGRPGPGGPGDLTSPAGAAGRLPGDGPPGEAAVPVEHHDLAGAHRQLACSEEQEAHPVSMTKASRRDGRWMTDYVEEPLKNQILFDFCFKYI